MSERPSPVSTDERDRTKRLFQYLAKVAALQAPVVSDITTSAAYEEVVWLGSLPDAAEVQTVVRGDPGAKGEWLVVKRPVFPAPPKPSDALNLWLDPAAVRDSARALSLNPTATVLREFVTADGELETRAVTLTLDDEPAIREEFVEFLADWETWAAEDRRLQPVHDAYSSAYAIYQRVTTLQEAYEVVLGVGLATRRRGVGAVRRHLLVARADVEMEPETGRIAIGPAGDGLGLHFEPEMLEVEEQPSAATIRVLSDQLVEVDDPLSTAIAGGILKAWTHDSGEDTQYDESTQAPSRIEGRLVVSFAPALMLRRRTRRAVVDFCNTVITGLDDPVLELPGAIRDLIERTDLEDDGRSGEVEADDASGEPMFPLPANDEQREIIDRLDRAAGIVVEGPPGTGKSHTIANLISHLTASGQRVLVTSHTARALTVLKGKLPKGIADLSVAVLGEGRERRENLEQSINALLARQLDADWQPREIERRITQLRSQKSQEEVRRTALIAEQRAARELEIVQHEPSIGDYRGTLSEIAERLVREREAFDWFEDAASVAPPPELAVAAGLLAVERSVDEERLRLAALVAPDPVDLPSPSEVSDALEAIAAQEHRAPTQPSRTVSLLASISDDERDVLIQDVTGVVNAVQEAMRSQSPWVGSAVLDTLGPQREPLQALADNTREALATLDPRLEELDGHVMSGVTWDNRVRIGEQARVLRDHLGSGGKLSHFGRRPEPVRSAQELLAGVRVDGHAPDTAERLGLVLRWIAAQDVLAGIEPAWAGRLPYPGRTLVERRALVVSALEDLSAVLRVTAARATATGAIARFPGLIAPHWTDRAAVEQLLADAHQAQMVARLEAARRTMRERLRPLRDATLDPRVAPEVTEALTAAIAGDARAYARSLTALRTMSEARVWVAERERVFGSMHRVAPRLALAIRTDPGSVAWDVRIAQLPLAWEWRRATAWLAALRTARPNAVIARELGATEKRIQELTGRITENLAWQHTLRTLTPFAQQNLKAYKAKMTAYGKGTGVNAQRHLNEARRFLEACQDAVPVWIMPTHLVAETIKARPAAFDVVIVDEASQSGVDSSFLMWLGRKMVVVGDEKQISPDVVGVLRSDANQLAQTYLHDFHFASVLGIDHSLFTQATVRYHARVRLREHFRCMPEIIEFSNRIAYADAPLVPLRQYGSDRLEPLVARYVEGAVTRPAGGSTVNDREAEEVVTVIERLCADPAYKGKTMGVISLLGPQQARRINDLLVRTLPPSELAERQLRCGDAHAFQGDERDIMFLSLVAAPDTGGGKLRSVSDRYNVAASRAKDQEWLFHSVTLSDLRAEDLRHRLLSHFVTPTWKDIADELVSVPEDAQVEPFESLFEQRVYRAIRSRGYRVTPQVRIHDYRIDLVVTGRDRKLAVECDGDFWHGAEQYTQDMGRQRDLERCGWTFVRIRGSDFFGDPWRALQPLWETLERMGIRPPDEAEPSSPRRATSTVGEAAVAPAPAAEHAAVSVADSSEEATIDVARVRPPSTPAPLAAIPTWGEQETLLPDETSLWSDRVSGVGRGAHDQGSATPDAVTDGSTEQTAAPPYERWKPDAAPPLPLTAAATRERLMALLLEIAHVEGPVLAGFAYRRLVKEAGGHRVSRGGQSELNQALELACRRGSLVRRDPLRRPGLIDQVVRSPDRPVIVVRERGDRDLDEIPPDEVATVARALAIRLGMQPGEALKRAVLDFYGRSRLTERASAYLDRCFTIFGDDDVRAAADDLAATLLRSGHSTGWSPSPLVAGPDVETPVHDRSEQAGTTVQAVDDLPFDDSETELDEEQSDEAPPFWEIVMEVARAAATLSSQQQTALSAVWVDADGAGELVAMRAAAAGLGAEPQWQSVARVMRTNLPDASGPLRGAATDVAYVRFLTEIAPSRRSSGILEGAPERLLTVFDREVSEASRSRDVARPALCPHGRPPGRCDYIACPHHPLSGIDTRRD
jgi:very-short-patch-repair endonuclease